MAKAEVCKTSIRRFESARRLQPFPFRAYVDELPTQATPSFTKLELRFAWKATESLELALVGQNLLDESHLEYGSINNPATSSLTERSALVQIRWTK